MVSLKDLLSGTNFRVETSAEFFDDTDFNPYVDIITLSGLQPPQARNGQFFFSKTGMYYDAYGGGLEFPTTRLSKKGVGTSIKPLLEILVNSLQNL